jgi:hypothetical protein
MVGQLDVSLTCRPRAAAPRFIRSLENSHVYYSVKNLAHQNHHTHQGIVPGKDPSGPVVFTGLMCIPTIIIRLWPENVKKETPSPSDCLGNSIHTSRCGQPAAARAVSSAVRQSLRPPTGRAIGPSSPLDCLQYTVRRDTPSMAATPSGPMQHSAIQRSLTVSGELMGRTPVGRTALLFLRLDNHAAIVRFDRLVHGLHEPRACLPGPADPRGGRDRIAPTHLIPLKKYHFRPIYPHCGPRKRG